MQPDIFTRKLIYALISKAKKAAFPKNIQL
jgi:hypothetical protein